MLIQRLALATTLACSVPHSSVSQTSPSTIGRQLSDLMRPGTVRAEVLEMWAPARLTVLSAKLQEAARADPAWWRAHAAQRAPGQPLPYDTRMRLTEPEYRELLAMTDSVEMRPASQASIQIEGTASGWRLGPQTTVAELRGIELDTIADQVRTSFGALTSRTTIEPSDAQRAIGRWSGVQWRREEMNEDGADGMTAQLAVGRLEASGHTLLFFDAKRWHAGQATSRSFRVVRWLPN